MNEHQYFGSRGGGSEGGGSAAPVARPGMKICSKCRKSRELGQFGMDYGASDNRRCECKFCAATRIREQRADIPRKRNRIVSQPQRLLTREEREQFTSMVRHCARYWDEALKCRRMPALRHFYGGGAHGAAARR